MKCGDDNRERRTARGWKGAHQVDRVGSVEGELSRTHTDHEEGEAEDGEQGVDDLDGG